MDTAKNNIMLILSVAVRFFSLSHARVMLINSFLKFHHRAQNLTSLFPYHTHDDFYSTDPSSMQDACHI